MRTPYLIFFLIVPLYSFSQVGISLSYDYSSAPEWDNTIRTYNFTRPWLEKPLNLLTHGYSAGMNYQFRIREKIFAQPELNLSHIFSKGKNNGNTFIVNVYLYSVCLNGNFHALNFGGRDSIGWKKNIFVQISPVLSLITARIKSEGEKLMISEDEIYKPINFAFNLGLGLGYDYRISKKIILVPLLKFKWYPRAEIDDFDIAVHGTSIYNLNNESPLYRVEAGANLLYKFSK